jgi:hypothetical protein
MKKNLFLFISIFVVLAVLLFLSSYKHAPLIPPDAAHQNIVSNDVCTECHGLGKKAPLKASHPPKEQCLICHKYR